VFGSAVAVLLDESRLEPALFEQPRDVVADLRAADDDHLLGGSGGLLGRDRHRELLDGFGRADDDDPIAGPDLCLAAGDLDRPVAEDRRERERLEVVGLLDRLVDERAPLVDLELRHLDPTAGEGVDVACGRQPHDSHDRLGGQQVRTHHEVDAERLLGPPPRPEVLGVFDPGDGEGVRDGLHRRTGNDVGLVVVGRGDDHVRRLQPGLFEGRDGGPVALNRHHVQRVVEFLGPVRVALDDDHVVCVSEVGRDRGSDLSGTDDDYAHRLPPMLRR
jgi:hypothetical protein